MSYDRRRPTPNDHKGKRKTTTPPEFEHTQLGKDEKELARGSPPLWSHNESIGLPAYGKQISITDGGQSLELCRDMAKAHDKQMCDNWKDEVEKLLIFSGLFSAVVTAFVVESYQWLQLDTKNASVSLLTNIALQLSDISNPNSGIVIPPITIAKAPFSPTNANIWINALWFISLVLSLSSALVGIVCVQWIRQYIQEHDLTATQWLKQRQILCDGLEAWHVRLFIVSLPVMLQLAVALFFVGMLVFLWNMNFSVALPVTIVTIVPLIFLLVTPFIPVLQTLCARYPFTFRDHNLCPYKTHQGLLLSKIVIAAALGFIWAQIALIKIGLFDRFLNMYHSSIISGLKRIINLFNNEYKAAPDDEIKVVHEAKVEEQTKRRTAALQKATTKYEIAKKLFFSWHWEDLDDMWLYNRSDPNEDGLPAFKDVEEKEYLEACAVHYDAIRSLVWLVNTFSRDRQKGLNLLSILRSTDHSINDVVFARVLEHLYDIGDDCVQAVKNAVLRSGDEKKDKIDVRRAAALSQHVYQRTDVALSLLVSNCSFEPQTVIKIT